MHELEGLYRGVGDLRTKAEELSELAHQLMTCVTEARYDAATRNDVQKIKTACNVLLDTVAHPEQRLGHQAGDLGEAISFIRHELRSPINVIKGYTEMLLEDVQDVPSEPILPSLRRLLVISDHILTEIEGLFRVTNASVSRPAQRAAASTSPSPSGNPESVASCHILAVDDAPENLEVLQRRLERLGHRVTTATNGPDALAWVRETKFDLVLLDLMMPGMDGHEVLVQIKSDAATADVPVVMISALNEISSVVRAIESGADDYLPKPFDPTLLRARVTSSLERKRLRDMERNYARLLQEKAALHEKELDGARRIQQAILPSPELVCDSFELRATMIPAKDVGGDFFDHFWLDEHRLGVVIADVSGKGMAAALFMALALAVLRTTAPKSQDPGACLTLVNRQLCKDNSTMMFVTLFYGVYDTRTHQFFYANAGHEEPYMVSPEGHVERLHRPGQLQSDGLGPPGAGKSSRGIVLGVMESETYRQKSVVVRPGASLFMVTDGITEAMSPVDEEFGDHRLVQALVNHHRQSAPGLLSGVLSAVRQHANGAAQSDDITCVALSRKVSE